MSVAGTKCLQWGLKLYKERFKMKKIITKNARDKNRYINGSMLVHYNLQGFNRCSMVCNIKSKSNSAYSPIMKMSIGRLVGGPSVVRTRSESFLV